MAYAKTPARPGRPRKEMHRLGEAIYERDIRAQVEADHRGEIVAIDVDSGSWAVAETARVAAQRLRSQWPDTNDVWLVRIGYRALRSFGAGAMRRIE